MRYAGILAALVAAVAVWMVFAVDQQVAGQMDTWAEGLFELFTKDRQFPLVLSAAIGTVAFVLLVAYFLLVVVPQSVSLRRLRAVVERCPDERAFAGRFHEISQRLAADRLIGHAWKEFQETLVKPGDQVDVVQNTTRPQSFINFGCAQNASTALAHHAPSPELLRRGWTTAHVRWSGRSTRFRERFDPRPRKRGAGRAVEVA